MIVVIDQFIITRDMMNVNLQFYEFISESEGLHISQNFKTQVKNQIMFLIDEDKLLNDVYSYCNDEIIELSFFVLRVEVWS